MHDSRSTSRAKRVNKIPYSFVWPEMFSLSGFIIIANHWVSEPCKGGNEVRGQHMLSRSACEKIPLQDRNFASTHNCFSSVSKLAKPAWERVMVARPWPRDYRAASTRVTTGYFPTNIYFDRHVLRWQTGLWQWLTLYYESAQSIDLTKKLINTAAVLTGRNMNLFVQKSEKNQNGHECCLGQNQ